MFAQLLNAANNCALSEYRIQCNYYSVISSPNLDMYKRNTAFWTRTQTAQEGDQFNGEASGLHWVAG